MSDLPSGLTAEDFHWWETEIYGSVATDSEKQERVDVVRALLDCHQRIATSYPVKGGNSFCILANEACGDLLDAVAKMLHTDRATVQPYLLDLPIFDREKRIEELLQKVRQPPT